MSQRINAMTKDLMLNDVAVVATTPMHALHSSVNGRLADHTILQEAFTADVGMVLQVLTSAKGTVHLTGDTEQLKGQDEDPKENCMAQSTNFPMVDCLIQIGHPWADMLQQYRTLNPLSDILSDLHFKGLVQCMVNPRQLPNA